MGLEVLEPPRTLLLKKQSWPATADLHESRPPNWEHVHHQ